MPFKSDAQRRYLYKFHPSVAREFQRHTPKGKKLPKHVKKSNALLSGPLAFIFQDDSISEYKQADEQPQSPPDYRVSNNPGVECASCKHFDKQGNLCTKYNSPVAPNGLCDDYEQIEIDVKKIQNAGPVQPVQPIEAKTDSGPNFGSMKLGSIIKQADPGLFDNLGHIGHSISDAVGNIPTTWTNTIKPGLTNAFSNLKSNLPSLPNPQPQSFLDQAKDYGNRAYNTVKDWGQQGIDLAQRHPYWAAGIGAGAIGLPLAYWLATRNNDEEERKQKHMYEPFWWMGKEGRAKRPDVYRDMTNLIKDVSNHPEAHSSHVTFPMHALWDTMNKPRPGSLQVDTNDPQSLQTGKNIDQSGNKLTQKEAFKAGFLLKCAEDQLTVDEIQTKVSNLLEKEAFLGEWLLGRGIGATVGAAKNLTLPAMFAGLSLPLFLGSAGGYLAAKANSPDIDQIKSENLKTDYLRLAQEAQRRKAIKDIHEADPGAVVQLSEPEQT